jgi:hypothetical protein
MTVIEPRRDARRAWAALPEATRREALAQAARGEAAADPAVAAVIVDALRDRSPVPSWMRRAVEYLPTALVIGCDVALQYLGIVSFEAVTTAVVVIGFVVIGAVLLAGGAPRLVDRVRRWWRRETPAEDLSADAIPARAELPNIRKVLKSAPARIAAPLTVHGQPRLRRTALFIALCAVTAVGFIALLERIRNERGDYHRLLHFHIGIIGIVLGLAALATWASWARHLRYVPLRIDETGLRFGFSRVVAWPDVLGVTLVGPTIAFPKVKPALVWTLRNRPNVHIELDAVTTLPEEIILAARAYRAQVLSAE